MKMPLFPWSHLFFGSQDVNQIFGNFFYTISEKPLLPIHWSWWINGKASLLTRDQSLVVAWLVKDLYGVCRCMSGAFNRE